MKAEIGQVIEIGVRWGASSLYRVAKDGPDFGLVAEPHYSADGALVCDQEAVFGTDLGWFCAQDVLDAIAQYRPCQPAPPSVELAWVSARNAAPNHRQPTWVPDGLRAAPKGRKPLKTVHRMRDGAPACGAEMPSPVELPERYDPWLRQQCAAEWFVPVWLPSYRPAACRACLRAESNPE